MEKVICGADTWDNIEEYCEAKEEWLAECSTVDAFNTSEVGIVFTEDNDVLYDILYPVAWDHIVHQTEFDDLVKGSDCLVYGSLSGRNEAYTGNS